ncbi:MAG: ribosome small subunit-dependent GTPase A [Bacteroidetes bacterium]|nr:MAG: ribosome small subunit-dependent GTPase A [Bacteroidota bacterium]
MRPKSQTRGATAQAGLAEGTVVRSLGTLHRIRSEEGAFFDCVVRGQLRIRGSESTHPVAVGDRVSFTPGNEDNPGVIAEVQPRRNYLLRKAIGHAHKVHILAANLDQAILLYTVEQPATSLGFANRFLITAAAYEIPAIVVINKTDILTQPAQQQRLAEVIEIYTRIGYPVYPIVANDPAYRELAISLLKDKVSFIGGHSGVGKSAFLNLADPSLNLKTGNISDYSSKGKHTTTYAEMYDLATGGSLIDSPGIKELGITDMEPEELAHFFPEMEKLRSECRFSNCVHINEPGCKIREAVSEGQIHPSRYDSYVKMLEDMK